MSVPATMPNMVCGSSMKSVIAVARELGFDMEKDNVNGGVIANGHSIGCSSVRIIVTLLHELRRRPDEKRGLATLCIGGGMGYRNKYLIQAMCAFFGVSRSGYYRYIQHLDTPKKDAGIAEMIRQCHQECGRTYG